jgi:dTDP-4-dehydrorhamnose reductase
LASDFAELLWQAQCQGLQGLHHLAGAERASIWHVARALADAGGMSLNAIPAAKNASRESCELIGEFRCDQETSLDSRKIQRALTRPLPRLAEGVARFVEQATNGYRDRLQSSAGVASLTASAA